MDQETLNQEALNDVIARVEQMEAYFDQMQEACRDSARSLSEPACAQMLKALKAYYEGGQWLRDYELDERGILPQTLKRGVLSQDGVYNLLTAIEDVQQ